MKAEMHRQNLRGRRPVRADRRLHADERRIRAQSAISSKSRKASLVLSITVFSARTCFTSARKTRLARGARNGRLVVLADETGYFELQRQNLRSRRPGRADRRLCTDERHIRAQSAISNRSRKASLGLSITVFSARTCFTSARETRLARGARNGRYAILDDKNPKPSLNAKCGGLGVTHG